MLARWKKSYDKPTQPIKKQRHHFADNGPYSQAMVFPVVTYGCESWTIKKAEHRKTDGFKDSSESLGLIKPVNPKGKSIMNIHWRN